MTRRASGLHIAAEETSFQITAFHKLSDPVQHFIVIRSVDRSTLLPYVDPRVSKSSNDVHVDV